MDRDRDIVVIGASAGGVEALTWVSAGFPEGMSASIFVVVHLFPLAKSNLPEILGRTCPLPVSHPSDGEPIRCGKVYVAPPDLHMLVGQGRVLLQRGPRENHSRPAIDPLFRSAARLYGPRVIGVVLSGQLDDGTAGLAAIKEHGGIAVVQNPDDALYPMMPRNAMESVQVDRVLPLREIAPAIVSLCGGCGNDGSELAQGDASIPETPEDNAGSREREAMSGKATSLTCPECGGVMFELQDGGIPQFMCRVGHKYSPDTMMSSQSESVEAALWAAVRSLEERESLAKRIAERHRQGNVPLLVSRFEERQREAREQADAIRRLLLASTPEAGPP